MTASDTPPKQLRAVNSIKAAHSGCRTAQRTLPFGEACIELPSPRKSGVRIANKRHDNTKCCNSIASNVKCDKHHQQVSATPTLAQPQLVLACKQGCDSPANKPPAAGISVTAEPPVAVGLATTITNAIAMALSTGETVHISFTPTSADGFLTSISAGAIADTPFEWILPPLTPAPPPTSQIGSKMLCQTPRHCRHPLQRAAATYSPLQAG